MKIQTTCAKLIFAITFATSAFAANQIRTDLNAIRSDLSAIVRSGAIDRTDVQQFLDEVRAALDDGSLSTTERSNLEASLKGLVDQIPANLVDKLQADVTKLKADMKTALQKYVDPEVYAAGQKVLKDLQKIQQGHYVTEAELAGFRSLVRSALKDGTVTDAEKAALSDELAAIEAKIPIALRDALKADVEALQAALGR
jgi:hypothetical protein